MHIILPSPPASHQPQSNPNHLENDNSRADVLLVVPETPCPDIPNQESRLAGFGRGRVETCSLPR